MPLGRKALVCAFSGRGALVLDFCGHSALVCAFLAVERWIFGRRALIERSIPRCPGGEIAPLSSVSSGWVKNNPLVVGEEFLVLGERVYPGGGKRNPPLCAFVAMVLFPCAGCFFGRSQRCTLEWP